jgi:hypothetical protein
MWRDRPARSVHGRTGGTPRSPLGLIKPGTRWRGVACNAFGRQAEKAASTTSPPRSRKQLPSNVLPRDAGLRQGALPRDRRRTSQNRLFGFCNPTSLSAGGPCSSLLDVAFAG